MVFSSETVSPSVQWTLVGSEKGADIPTALNRGASGIDGLIASACGYSSGMQKPSHCLLATCQLYTILIHSNYSQILLNQFCWFYSIITEEVFFHSFLLPGRQIFSKPFFAAPHDYNFRKVSSMFNLNYFNPGSISAFETDYSKAIQANKSAVIEIISEREKNPQYLESLRQKLVKSAFESSS